MMVSITSKQHMYRCVTSLTLTEEDPFLLFEQKDSSTGKASFISYESLSIITCYVLSLNYSLILA